MLPVRPRPCAQQRFHSCTSPPPHDPHPHDTQSPTAALSHHLRSPTCAGQSGVSEAATRCSHAATPAVSNSASWNCRVCFFGGEGA